MEILMIMGPYQAGSASGSRRADVCPISRFPIATIFPYFLLSDSVSTRLGLILFPAMTQQRNKTQDETYDHKGDSDDRQIQTDSFPNCQILWHFANGPFIIRLIDLLHEIVLVNPEPQP